MSSYADLYLADLFAGAGGITQGFRNAGYTPVAAVEMDRWAAKTYSANFGDHVLACPIQAVKLTRNEHGITWAGYAADGSRKALETPEIDVLVGGPPCQGFSPLGRMKNWNYSDPRNLLWRHYFKLLRFLRPKAFLLENVPELLKSTEFAMIRRRAFRLGYRLVYGVLNASHYGVPQNRKRAMIIGSYSHAPKLPLATIQCLTVRDAIGDLPLTPDGYNWHLQRNPHEISVERYKCIPEGGNRFDLIKARPDITPRCWLKKSSGSTDVFGRMKWDAPAPTIRTEFFKPEKGRYLHPQEHRPITIREAARFQTFPDDFQFAGSNVQVAKQIGNAVPVELAFAIARHLKASLMPRDLADASIAI
jgi:DNA (cytosine-5)-methyltransferase 1